MRIGWNSIGKTLASRRARAAVLAIIAFGLLCAGAAAALKPKAHNWPNSFVRHTLRDSVPQPTQAFTENLHGDIATAGNTLMTCSQNLPVTRERRHAPRAIDNAACLNESNNGLDMAYVNKFSGGDRFNSSQATLTLPTGARVVKAYLYWAADLSRGVSDGAGCPRTGQAAPAGNSPDNNNLYRTVELQVGGGSYATINATDPNRDGRWNSVASWYSQPGNCPGWAYQVRADVTNQLGNALLAGRARRTGKDLSLPVTVANVQAGTGHNRYAGWNLIVVWEAPTAPWRNVTLYDGFAFVQVKGDEQLVVGPLNFTGFKTPVSGSVKAKVTVWATEGDRGITGDYLALGGLSGSCTDLKRQSDDAHPLNNFFNSSISNGGLDVPGRTPSFSNQLGFDLTTLNVPEGTIPNAAEGASVCLGTSGDTYFFGGIGFSSLIQAPNLQIAKAADRTDANPGDVVTYTTTVTNPKTRPHDDPLFGTDVNAATNLVVADALPSGLDFVAFTVNPGDACGYNSATRAITCNAGTLQPDGEFTYAYQARVAAVAAGAPSASLVNTACYKANSVDQPNAIFNGCDPASIVVPPGPPVPADLGVVKMVDHNSIAPGATLTWTVVGTNYGPATSTGFVMADQLPPGVQFVSVTASAALLCTTPAVGASGAVVCTAPSVPAAPAAGSSLTLKIVATVPSTTANGTVLANIATVNGDQSEPTPDPHPNRDTALTLVLVPDQPIPPPEPTPVPPTPPGPPQPPVAPVHPPNIPGGPAGTLLKLLKTGSPATASLGDSVTYVLRVSNVGDAGAMKVRVCDTPPAGLTVTSAPGFKRSGNSFCTTISKLAIGRRKTLHVTARVTTTSTGRLINHATVESRNAPTRRARATTIIHTAPSFTG